MTRNSSTLRQFLIFAVCAATVLLILFWKSFDPRFVFFSNDGPLGAQHAAAIRQPSAFSGVWFDLNSIGSNGGSFYPGFTATLLWILGPLYTAKFYAMISIGILGLCAWLGFRLMNLTPLACFLGGLAVLLNSAWFSNSCWGVGTQSINAGMSFLAIGLLADTQSPRRWWRAVLAGLAVGMGVIEGFDVGVLFSLCVAAYTMYLSIVGESTPPTPRERRWVASLGNAVLVIGLAAAFALKFLQALGPLKLVMVVILIAAWNWALFSRVRRFNAIAIGAARTGVVAVFALFMAAQAVTTLIGTQVKGISGMGQDTESKARRWVEATHWSFPKREALSLFVPELFGCRMDTPNNIEMLAEWFDGGSYWGAIGREPVWDGYFSRELQPGDALKIFFSEAPNLNSVRVIQTDGHLTLPMIGDVPAAGLTRFNLQRKLSALSSQSTGRILLETPGGSLHFSGGSVYFGVLVAVLALWAAVRALRRGDPSFSPHERKLIWFWLALAVLSLLFSFGRFAPFYRLIYALPFFSAMRNPTKFLTIVHLGTMMLFAYGIHGLSRRCMDSAASSSEGLIQRLKSWWAKAAAFDRRWTIGSLVVVVAGVIGWRIYAASRVALEDYLSELDRLTGYASDTAQSVAHAQALFSIAQVGWFVLFLALAVGLLILISSGWFSGKRAIFGGVLLGLLLVADLGRANLPFLIDWDYRQKYDMDPANSGNSTNPLINFLRDKPYEHRVAILPFAVPDILGQMYRIEWAQHHFQYYEIQSLDKVQMPRVPENLLAFESALQPRGTTNSIYLITRLWELTNTRYLIGVAGWVDQLNRELDAGRNRFRIAQPFSLAMKPGFTEFRGHLEEVTAAPTTNGPFAIIDFTGALPRAKLYANWRVSPKDPATVQPWLTNLQQTFSGDVAAALAHLDPQDQATLCELTSKSFEPDKTVLLPSPPPGAPASASGTNLDAGTVEFSSYAPKDIRLHAVAKTPCVLLLNDKYDPDWQVWVDGRRAELLRCNFIMRGVYLTPGEHTIQFLFQPPVGARYVTLTAIGFGLLLLGYLAVSKKHVNEPTTPPASHPAENAKKPEPARRRNRPA